MPEVYWWGLCHVFENTLYLTAPVTVLFHQTCLSQRWLTHIGQLFLPRTVLLDKGGGGYHLPTILTQRAQRYGVNRLCIQCPSPRANPACQLEELGNGSCCQGRLVRYTNVS